MKKVLQIKKKFSIIIKTRYALRRCLTGTENRGNPARPSRRKPNPVFIIILIIITKKTEGKMEAKQVTQPEERGWAQRLHFVCIFADGF